MDNLEKIYNIIHYLEKNSHDELYSSHKIKFVITDDLFNGSSISKGDYDFSKKGKELTQEYAEILHNLYFAENPSERDKDLDIQAFLNFLSRKINNGLYISDKIKSSEDFFSCIDVDNLNGYLKKLNKKHQKSSLLHHNHGDSVLGYDPAWEAFQKFDHDILFSQAAAGLGDNKHHIEEGLIDPSNTFLIKDEISQKWVTVNFGHGVEQETEHVQSTSFGSTEIKHEHNHDHSRYIPHIPTNAFITSFNEIKSENNEDKASVFTNLAYSGFRIGANGVNSAISANADIQSSDIKLNSILFRGYKPLSQDKKGFTGLEASILYSNNDHEAQESRPLQLPHIHSPVLIEGKTFETSLAIKRTARNFSFGIGSGYLLAQEDQKYLSVKSELSFVHEKLPGLGFFATSSLYTNAAYPKYGIEGSQVIVGINYEKHGHMPLAHIKFAKNDLLNKNSEHGREISYQTELNMNTSVTDLISLGSNISYDFSEEEKHARFSTRIEITPKKHGYIELGFDYEKKIETEDLNTLTETAKNFFAGAVIRKSGLEVGARVNTLSNQSIVPRPIMQINLGYNLNLADNKKTK